MSFMRTLSSLMRTWVGLPGRSPIAPSQARLTLEFFSDGLPEKKFQLVDMSILINPIKPWAGMSQKCMGSFVTMCAGLRTERGEAEFFGSVGRFEL
jgi:hypothetical protein